MKAGCRVAICDQLEDPKMAKTIVKRGVTELVTPGVALNDDVLEQKKNNYLAAIAQGKKTWGIAFLDISTGDFLVSEGNLNHLNQLIQKFSPAEILVPKPLKATFNALFGTELNPFFQEDWVFQDTFAQELLQKHFNTSSLKGFGLEHFTSGIISAGAVLHYLSETQHNKLQHITSLQKIASDDFVGIDRFTARNLELLYSNATVGVALIDVIDYTATPMGGRLLRKWVSFPLKSVKKIQKRHALVNAYIESNEATVQLRHHLKKIGDIERLMAKIATQKISPRELNILQQSILESNHIKNTLLESGHKEIIHSAQQLPLCKRLNDTIANTIKEEAPVAISKGNFIAEGFSAELDELRALLRTGKSHLDAMLERETEATGIPSLKIAFNNVFGYYIEVRKPTSRQSPRQWTRKQTLVNAERYITEELKEYENKILGAEDKIQQLELRFYQELLDQLQNDLSELKQAAVSLSQIDCLQSFAHLATKHHYCCPQIDAGTHLDITEGRHPVIEQQLPAGEAYIANDLLLNREEQQIIMITGPNMSGKSALLRQTALIVLLAQMGSFVPAKAVKMGIVDHIFTRVGASDNISLGESTFMVEMNESAAILNNITASSLVLLDEIGEVLPPMMGFRSLGHCRIPHQHPANPNIICHPLPRTKRNGRAFRSYQKL